MLEEHARTPGVILRMLVGGMLVLLSLPLLLPLIVGTLVTGVINGVCVLTRRSRSNGQRDH